MDGGRRRLLSKQPLLLSFLRRQESRHRSERRILIHCLFGRSREFSKLFPLPFSCAHWKGTTFPILVGWVSAYDVLTVRERAHFLPVRRLTFSPRGQTGLVVGIGIPAGGTTAVERHYGRLKKAGMIALEPVMATEQKSCLTRTGARKRKHTKSKDARWQKEAPVPSPAAWYVIRGRGRRETSRKSLQDGTVGTGVRGERKGSLITSAEKLIVFSHPRKGLRQVCR